MNLDALEKIKKLQKEKGWSGTELAERAGLSPSVVSMMYKRNNQPSIPTLQAICSAFGITVAQFFADSNVPPDLTPEQVRLLERWNSLTNEQKEALLALINSI